jgi:hypothetical protein
MDAKLSVSSLREHSEQLRTLAAALSEKLDHLEQELAEEKNSSETTAGSPLEGVAELNSSFFAVAEIFHQRLYTFLANTTRQTRGLSDR